MRMSGDAFLRIAAQGANGGAVVRLLARVWRGAVGEMQAIQFLSPCPVFYWWQGVTLNRSICRPAKAWSLVFAFVPIRPNP